MNIITGYLSSDEGSVEIDGTDIMEEPEKAKKKIGYLPEVPPLYNDMTVQKYLEFMFRLKKVRLPMKEHIFKICEMVKITDVQDRIIKHLSKGYRQRVGLAQALLGDPPVLILDEPTVGLDPQQIIEIRKLIRELGKEHTIILSSHVLSEVQAVCDKIIIINHGRIAARGLTAEMTRTGDSTQRLNLVIEGKNTAVKALLSRIDGVSDVMDKGECEKGCYEYTVDCKKDVRRLIFRAIARSDFSILSMSPVGVSLEDTYLDIISGKTEEED